jgi:hypothetical protein
LEDYAEGAPRTPSEGGTVDEERSMKRHVTSALIAGAMTAVSGIAFFLGISRSIAWLFGPAYLLMTPGLFLAFFLGLGSGAHGAVLHTDFAQYVLTFLVWWGVVTFAGARAGGAKREPKGAQPKA